jgi:hypothetical protein
MPLKNGLLAKKALTRDTTTKLNYAVSAGAVATLCASVSNRVNGPAIVSIWLGANDPPIDDDHIYTGEVAGYGGFDRSGLAASAGEFLTVRASTDAISVRLHGFEEAA